MQYYQKLRKLREDRNLTQQDIADRLGVKQQQYSNYERGLQELPIEHLVTLCLFYGVSANYILSLPKDYTYPER